MKLTQAPAAVPSETKPLETPSKPKSGKLWKILLVAAIVGGIGVGGFFAWKKFGGGGPIVPTSGTPFATQKVNDLTVNFIHPKGQLQNAMNEILMEFRDATSGELVDVGTVRFDLDMNMLGMVMHSGSTIQPTGTPGLYRANVKPNMAGDWMATLRYEGPRGNGSVSFSVNVKQ